MYKSRETIPSGVGRIRQEFFFIEYGHDGYQKNPSLMQISIKSSYLNAKMHLEKVTGKNDMKKLK
jgi:hypothetical protein